MPLPLLVPVFLPRPLLLDFCIALNICQSHDVNSRPLIEFTNIPPPAQGGRERVDMISGRAEDARPNQQIVVRTAGRAGCSPGRLASDREGDQ